MCQMVSYGPMSGVIVERKKCGPNYRSPVPRKKERGDSSVYSSQRKLTLAVRLGLRGSAHVKSLLGPEARWPLSSLWDCYHGVLFSLSHLLQCKEKNQIRGRGVSSAQYFFGY